MSACAKKAARQKAKDGKAVKEAEARERKEAQALRPVVRDVLSTRKMPWPEKDDRIAHALRSMLAKVGKFYRTVDGVPLFFRTAERKVYEITGRAETDFARYVTYLCDFSARVPPLFRSIDRIRATVVQSAPVAQLNGLAYNAPNLDVVMVNDFGGGMWFRKRGGNWMWRPNGYNDILFWTPSAIVEPWEPEFGVDWLEDIKHLDWLIHQAHFAEHALTIHDQRMLLRALVLAPLFPALGKNRPVHAHLGLDDRRQHDTGKTTTGKMLGLVFVGSKFEPMPPPEGNEKGQEALALELAHKPLVLLDNVDTDIKWLNDFLCTYCTGAAPSKRKLYTDTQQVSIEYRGRLIITSRKASFKRPDTASRTIPFRFEPIAPEERKTECELLAPITEHRGKVWAGILATIGRVQDEFPKFKPPAPVLRVADFERLGYCIAAVFGDVVQWQAMVPRLGHAQARFALDGEALVMVLRKLLEAGDVTEQKTSEFFNQLGTVAAELGLDFNLPTSPSAFTTRLNETRDALEAMLDVKIATRTLHGHTLIKVTRGASWGPHEVTEVTGLTTSVKHE